MNARAEILFALEKHFRHEPDARTAAVDCLADYDAARPGRLRDFTPVFTTSDGSDVPATELRCVLCGGVVQAVGVKTLLDINALASSHDCQKGGAS